MKGKWYKYPIKNKIKLWYNPDMYNDTKKTRNFSIENVDMDNMLKYFKENNNRRDKFKEYRKRKY